MKRVILGLAAAAASLALAPAASAGIFIGVAVNGGPITQVATDAGGGSANYNTTSGGYFYNVSATGFPLLSMPQLLTQSVNILNAGGANATIDLYITQTDLASLTGGLLSSFTSNTVAGLTAQMRSYYSSANNNFANNVTGGQTLLATGTTFSGPGTFTGGNALTVAGPWSETVRYTLVFSGGAGSNFNGTANLTAVPEPATWGLMLLGFGAMGGLLRTRNRKARIRFA